MPTIRKKVNGKDAGFFLNLLSAAIKNSPYKQKDLAKELRISLSHFNHILNGEKKMTLDIYLFLLNKLEISHILVQKDLILGVDL